MGFNIVLNYDDRGAPAKAGALADQLGRAEAATDRARDAMGRFAGAAGDAGAAGAAAGDKASRGLDQAASAAARAAGSLSDLDELVTRIGAHTAGVGEGVAGFSGRELEILERVKGPMREHIADIEALNRLNTLGQVSVKQYEDELVKLEQRYGASSRAESLFAQSLDQEAKTLERLRGPMRAYEQEVATLERLMKQGKLTADEYQTELDKQAKKAGVWQGPISGGASPKTPSDAQGSLAGGLGVAGSLMAGGIIGAGVMSLGQGIESLVERYRDLQDVSINATNAAQRFADAQHSVTGVMDEQIALANALHSTYTTTIDVYRRVTEATDELAISHADQVRLTQLLGEAAQNSGQSLDAAAGLASKFSYALATGTLNTRELKSIMKEFPDIIDAWARHFDTTRAGLLDMVKSGKVGTEDLMRAIIDEGSAIDATFAKRERTNDQKKEEWILNEKLYAQRYDVAFGRGHETQATVDALKKGERESGDMAGLQKMANGPEWLGGTAAKAAIQQLQDENVAAMTNIYDSVVNLTGPFQALGDKLRAAEGDTAAVRAEVNKLHEPVEAARHQIDVLNQAFGAGKIDLVEYQAAYEKAMTTLRQGIPSEAYKLNKPIEDARRSLELLKEDMRHGAIEGGLETYKKEELALQTTINGGRTPENLRITAPIAQARIELQELETQMKSLGGNSEAVRKRYDELMTTINDGRLPETIKFWEALHEPLAQTTRDIAALNSLYAAGRIGAAAYEVELSKVTEAHIKFLQSNNPSLERKLPDLAIDTELYEKSRDPLGQDKAGGDPLGAALERHAKLIQAEKDELTKIKEPARQWQLEVEALGKLFEAQLISPARYDAQIEAVRLAFLNAQPEALTFGQRVEAAFLKAKLAAREAGVEAKSYVRVLEEQQVALLEAKPGTRTTDDLTAIALLKDKEAAEAAGVAASSYAQVLDRVRAAQLAAGAEGKTFVGGMEAGWIKLKQEADAFGATVATTLLDDVDKLNQAIVTAANGGAVSWGQMVDSMIQDLERLILKQLEVQAINAIFGVASGGGEAGMLAGLGDGLMKNAIGGQYVATGGPAGTDAQVAQLRVTRGETLTVQTPEQRRADGGGSGGSRASPTQAAPVVNIHNHNHIDDSVVTAALPSRAGERAVSNILRRQNYGMKRR